MKHRRTTWVRQNLMPLVGMGVLALLMLGQFLDWAFNN